MLRASGRTRSWQTAPAGCPRTLIPGSDPDSALRKSRAHTQETLSAPRVTTCGHNDCAAPPSEGHAAAPFPHVADEDPCEQVVHGTRRLEDREADQRDEPCEDDLITRGDRRRRRIGQDEEREVQHRL